MPQYELSTDPARLDRDLVHRWLSEQSYWAIGRVRALTDRAVEGSLNIGAYSADGRQVGYARVVSDRTTFAWLCDVFVVEAHRGQGIGGNLVRAALEDPELATVRQWQLATRDAHSLYERFGFTAIDERILVLQRHVPELGGLFSPPTGSP